MNGDCSFFAEFGTHAAMVEPLKSSCCDVGPLRLISIDQGAVLLPAQVASARRLVTVRDAARLLNLTRTLLKVRGRCGRWSAPETLCARPVRHDWACGGAV